MSYSFKTEIIVVVYTTFVLFSMTDGKENAVFGKLPASICRKTETGEISSEYVNRTNSGSVFNYGVCLENNNETEKALRIFESLLSNLSPNDTTDNNDFLFDEDGFIQFDEETETTRSATIGHIVLLYCKLNVILDKTKELLNREKYVYIRPVRRDSQNCIVNSLRLLSNKIPKYGVYIFSYENAIHLYLPDKHSESYTKFYASNTVLQEDVELPSNLDSIHLHSVNFESRTGTKLKNYDIGRYIVNVKEVVLQCGYEAADEIPEFENGQLGISVFLKNLSSVERLSVEGCKIILGPNKISPEYIKFRNVGFTSENSNPEVLKYVLLNNYTNFDKTKDIFISTEERSTTIYIDMLESVKLNSLYLIGKNTKIVNWTSAIWEIQKLYVNSFTITKRNQLTVKKFIFSNTDIDISALPTSIEELSGDIRKSNKFFASREIETFPYLNYVSMNFFSPLFSNSFKFPNLTFMRVHSGSHPVYARDVEINPKDIPSSVKVFVVYNAQWYNMKIEFLGNTEKELEQLTLVDFEDHEILKILPKFQLTYLGTWVSEYTNKLVDILNYPFKEFVVCGPEMSEYDFEKSLISKHVDKNSECFVFTGKAIGYSDDLVNQRIWPRNDEL